MELPDTSVWIDHLRRNEPTMLRLLARDAVLIHPYITGELAMGQLQPRARALTELTNLPQIEVARPDEVLAFVERNVLYGIGIGYVDAHLLLATYRTKGLVLWTRDKRLRAAAERLRLASSLA